MNLKQQLKQAGLSQVALAKLGGFTTQSVNNWCQGRQPVPKYVTELVRMVEALNNDNAGQVVGDGKLAMEEFEKWSVAQGWDVSGTPDARMRRAVWKGCWHTLRTMFKNSPKTNMTNKLLFELIFKDNVIADEYKDVHPDLILEDLIEITTPGVLVKAINTAIGECAKGAHSSDHSEDAVNMVESEHIGHLSWIGFKNGTGKCGLCNSKNINSSCKSPISKIIHDALDTIPSQPQVNEVPQSNPEGKRNGLSASPNSEKQTDLMVENERLRGVLIRIRGLVPPESSTQNGFYTFWAPNPIIAIIDEALNTVTDKGE